MSNRDLDTGNQTIARLLRFALRGFQRDMMNTAFPGLIEAYDGVSKRADVQPAIDLAMTNGRTTPRPVLFDIPVIHPSGGGFVAHLPLVKGDPVWCVCAQRDMERFKVAYQRTTAQSSRLMMMMDAVAFPGFGAREITLPRPDAMTMQTEDGADFIALAPNHVEIVTPGNVTVNAGGIITLDSGGDTLVVQ